jgi:putative endonuclease
VSRVTFFSAGVPDHDPMAHHYYVYILASKSRVLYVGVTNNLESRLRQHRDETYSGFAEHYKAFRFVYYEVFAWVQDAIAREKQIKRWRREKKVFLIELANPTWEDLSAEWTCRLRIRTPNRVKGQRVPPLRFPPQRAQQRRSLGTPASLRSG